MGERSRSGSVASEWRARRAAVALAFVVVTCAPVVACTPAPAAAPSGAAVTTAQPSPVSAPTATPTSAPPATTAPTAAAPSQATVVLPERSSGCATAHEETGDRTVTLTAAGEDRTAIVHVPPKTKPGVALPLVLNLHGAFSVPEDAVESTGLSAVADARGFVVAYPAAAGEFHIWNIRSDSDTESDVAFIDALLGKLGDTLCLDPRRTYVSGFSAGGGMAKVLACRLDGRIAGVELVSPVIGPQLGDCLPAHPVSTIVFAGILDPLLPYYGGRMPIPLLANWPRVIGVDEFMAGWAANNGCTGEPAAGEPIGWAEPVTWQGCQAATRLYRLGDAGHTWPGSAGDGGPFGQVNHDVSASELLWTFFNGD